MTLLFLTRVKLDEGPAKERQRLLGKKNLGEMTQADGVFRGHKNAMDSESTDGSRCFSEFVSGESTPIHK